jgi:flagellar hook-basal body complex protein FliE
MVNINPNISGVQNLMKDVLEQNSVRRNENSGNSDMSKIGSLNNKTEFSNTVKAVENYISNVDDLQQSSDMSIKDLLSGKNEDVTSVVSEVAKADVSFKLLVGVRNKIIEAYKQTMNMQI